MMWAWIITGFVIACMLISELVEVRIHKWLVKHRWAIDNGDR